MDTFREVVKRWPSYRELAADIGGTYGQVQLWHHRDRIPSDWWALIARAANRRGLRGISVETLSELAARRKTSGTRAA